MTIVSVAAFFRLSSLGATGFAEDETNKVRAIESYAAGDFSANAEHPMLLKLAVWGSVRAASAWNRAADRVGAPPISLEAAVRLPNAVAGVATTLAVFLLTQEFFDVTVGLWAALFWALDVNATAINRLTKEDTLLVVFLLLAAWFYERGKRQGLTNPRAAQREFAMSGASFGLMLASKYMPHFFGLHAIFFYAADPHPGLNRPDKGRFYGAMLAAFACFNFAVFLPSTWRYLLSYVQGGTLIHTGYLFAHHLYLNTMDTTPWGLPIWFYATDLVTKIPLAILGAFGVGLFELARRRRERGAIFLRVMLVFVLVPYSLMAAKFLRYMLPLFATIDIVAAIGMVWLLRRLTSGSIPRLAGAAAATALAIGTPLSAELSAAPYFSMYQNPLGARVAPPGWLFPDDELHDAGMREAVLFVAGCAQTGAAIASDAIGVVGEYLGRSGRADIANVSLSRDGLPNDRPETYVLAQDAHYYFENAETIDQIRRRFVPVREFRVRGALSVQVFRLPGARGGDLVNRLGACSVQAADRQR
jgi:hypothetical protein